MSFSKWDEVKLEDVVDTISQKHKFDIDNIILVNTSDVLEGKVLNHKYVPNKNLRGQFKKSFQKDDILYSEIRPQNKRFAYIDFDSKDYVASTKLMVLRKRNNNITSDFLYQILKSDDIINKLQIIAESRSGTFPQITFTELSRLDILLPPPSEQKAIADTLSCLDDKIELNNRINKNLEEMAQAIFKSWFVDFEPFQDGEFEDSELGRIPKGWRVVGLGDIVKFIKGKKPKELIDVKDSDFQEQYLTIDALNGGIPQFANIEKMVLANMYDILMVMDGASSGTVYFGLNGIIASTIGKVEVKNEQLREVVYQYLKINESEVKTHNTGSAIPHADKGYVSRIKIAIPPEKELNEIESILLKIREVIINNKMQEKTLNTICDSLLPKLMSGEIRVPLEEAIVDVQR